MIAEKMLELLREEFPEALLADGYEQAIIGIAEGWFDHSQQMVVAYDYSRCIELLMESSDMSEEEAEEYFHFNVAGAYAGERTPVFLHDWRRL